MVAYYIIAIYNILYSFIGIARADGSTSSPTTIINLVFDRPIPGLSIDDITVDKATKGTLIYRSDVSSSTSVTYSLTISNITSNIVTVAIDKAGCRFNTHERTVEVDR